jgi:hypothetical protein
MGTVDPSGSGGGGGGGTVTTDATLTGNGSGGSPLSVLGVKCVAGTTPVAVGEVGCNTVTVSSAQLLAINGNPVTIIATPGANKVIQVLSAALYYKFITAQYTGGDTPALTYTNFLGNGAGPQLPPNLITATASKFTSWLSNASGSLNDAASDANQPVVFADDVNYAAGSGMLTITLLYTVFAL